MAKRVPDLTGAWIERVESVEGRVTLFVDGVRRLSLVLGGHIVFEGVDRLEGTSPRPSSVPPVLRSGMRVYRQRDEPGTTVLELREHVWSGEVDESSFTISHSLVSSELRVRLGRTVRAWMGFYPRARDRQAR